MARATFFHTFLSQAHDWLQTRTVTIFVITTAVLGGYFLVMAPPFMGTDEAAHFFRIFQLSEGKLLADKFPSGHYGGEVPENLDRISSYVREELPVHKNRREPFRPAAAYYDLLKQPPSPERVQTGFTGAGGYSPVSYAPMIGAMMVGRSLDLSNATLLYSVRAANLVTYMVLGVIGLWLLRGRKSQWFVLVILTLPMSLFEAATVNADAVLIGLCLLFLCALLRYWHDKQPSRVVLAALCVSAILVPLAKVVYVFLALLAPLALMLRRHWGRRSYLYAVGLALAIGIPATAWVLATRGPNQAVGVLITDLAPADAPAQIDFILRHPWQLLAVLLVNPFYHILGLATGMVGMLGANVIWAPPIVTLAGLFALLVAFSQADELQHMPRPSSRWWHVGLVLAALLGLVALFLGFYITFTAVGKLIIRGIQGRYLIPFIPFLFWGFAYGKKSRLRQKTSKSYAPLITFIIIINALTMAAIYTWAIRGQLPTFVL